MERYRITADSGVYFVTFTIVEWLPVLTNETACNLPQVARTITPPSPDAAGEFSL